MATTELHSVQVAEPDPRAHLSTDELARAFAALSPAPRDAGRVTLIVAREAHGRRATPQVVKLSPEAGTPGDLWSRADDPEAEMQLATVQSSVAELIANGQPLSMFGDNLYLDLDLSSDNLPAGSRLRAGGATLEVTPEPHNGCVLYQARFGADALRFISAVERRARKLRGIYLRVVDAGEVRVGDTVEVISRP
jgi:hypothetical protein